MDVPKQACLQWDLRSIKTVKISCDHSCFIEFLVLVFFDKITISTHQLLTGTYKYQVTTKILLDGNRTKLFTCSFPVRLNLNPSHFFNCQLNGHSSSKCLKEKTSIFCAKSKHSGSSYRSSPKCAACTLRKKPRQSFGGLEGLP